MNYKVSFLFLTGWILADVFMFSVDISQNKMLTGLVLAVFFGLVIPSAADKKLAKMKKIVREYLERRAGSKQIIDDKGEKK